MCCNNCNGWNVFSGNSNGCGCGNSGNANRCGCQFEQISTSELLAIRNDFLNAPMRITQVNDPFASNGCCCRCCGCNCC